MRLIWLLIIFCFSFCFAKAQSHLALNRDYYNIFENALNDKECKFHTTIKPYLIYDLRKYINLDSIRQRQSKNKDYSTAGNEKSHIDAGLLFNLQPGIEFSKSENVIETAIGIYTQGAIGKKFAFHTRFYSAASKFISYVDSSIAATKVIPGESYSHPTSFGYTYRNYAGYVSYTPSSYFDFNLGYDKNFLGDGYRSLLLSDYANNYPYFRISTNAWKIKYVNLYTMLFDVRNSGGRWSKFRNKYGSFHFLSVNITNHLNIGFFEAVVWQGTDSSGTRGFDVNYLNPVIFFRPVEYSVGSPDNALIGLTFKLKFARKHQLYGQIILDEFLLKEVKAGNGWWANKQGFQTGFKRFDAFFKNLDFQTELNYVRPYTYSHGNSLQNYTHFYQPLAHPLAANFYESVSFLSYRYKNWFFEGKLLYAVYGEDTSITKSWGKNLYLNYPGSCSACVQEYNNKTTQGIKTTLVYADFRASYLIIPQLNLTAEAGISNRMQNSILNTSTAHFIYFALKTGFSNRYSDF